MTDHPRYSVPGCRGPVICRGDRDYPAVRAIWNPYADRWPAVIVRCRDVLDGLAEVTSRAADATTTITFLRLAPPLPWMPPAVVGSPVIMIGVAHLGEPEDGLRAVDPLHHLGAGARFPAADRQRLAAVKRTHDPDNVFPQW